MTNNGTHDGPGNDARAPIFKRAKITKEIRVDGVEAIHGVTFDGALVWFADGTRGGLVAVDPQTEKVAQRWPHIPADAGTAFDGTHLYQIAVDRIQKIDPATGDVVAIIAAPGQGRDSGMTYANGKLWVGEYRTGVIHKIDAVTGKLEKTLRSDHFVTGVTFVDGQLWHGSWDDKAESAELRRVAVDDGAVLERLQVPKGVFVSGVEADGHGRFWCGDAKSGTLRAVEA